MGGSRSAKELEKAFLVGSSGAKGGGRASFKGAFGKMKGLGFEEGGGERMGEERDLFSEGLGGGSGEEKGPKEGRLDTLKSVEISIGKTAEASSEPGEITGAEGSFFEVSGREPAVEGTSYSSWTFVAVATGGSFNSSLVFEFVFVTG
ncbi:Uncharacterized protein Rs2_21056 [Raphanus sativus]|nr:Uncharacterized protein Rs2_21056 [Raphanus sativus]